MKRVRKKVPLLPKSAKKDTLFSDLLRSEPHSEKDTLFCEFLNTHVNTHRKCEPPGGGGAVEKGNIHFQFIMLRQLEFPFLIR